MQIRTSARASTSAERAWAGLGAFGRVGRIFIDISDDDPACTHSFCPCPQQQVQYIEQPQQAVYAAMGQSPAPMQAPVQYQYVATGQTPPPMQVAVCRVAGAKGGGVERAPSIRPVRASSREAV